MDLNFSSEKLITQRKLKGLSQDKLAEKAGINIRTLQRIEKNEVKPQLYTLGCLADSLGVRIEDLTNPIAISLPEEKSPRQLSLLHFSALAGCLIPLGNIIAPLFLWLHKKQTSDIWNNQAQKVINFQISWLIYLFVALVLYFTIEQLAFFVFLFPVITIMNILILPVYSGILVIKNKPPFYPLTINFLKNKYENIV
jgi:serine-type D-Ala-D-Ala carboxypeptidase/endopeptidase